MKRKANRFLRRNWDKVCLFVDILFIVMGILYGLLLFRVVKDVEMLKSIREKSNPPRVSVGQCVERGRKVERPLVGQNIGISPTPRPEIFLLSGEASYYSRSGCVGCSENMVMANGEPLDDNNLTVALPRRYFLLLVNEMVRVKNVVSGLSVQAKVTDSGGFDSLGRVADLSLATKSVLGCSDLCQVEIYR